MTERIRVAVLFGGRSGEHEVSLRSAWNVIQALDPARYDVTPVAITKEGRWRTGPDTLRLLGEAQRDLQAAADYGTEVALPADPTRRGLVPLDGGTLIPIDVVFPVLHGTFGEDGTLQGLLDLAGLPYVGSGVLASSVGMDKAIMKIVFRDAGLPVCAWIVTRAGDETPAALAARVAASVGYPCFVKPANLGSSVGISKVKTPAELAAAVTEAASYDPKVVIERGLDVREFECAVMGNAQPDVSCMGELLPSHEFYDYADKYVDGAARVEMPARIAPELVEQMRAMAATAFRSVDCAGLARVDFFLERGTNTVYINEINTMPGCTDSSMFPMLWRQSGIEFPAVVDRLITLARERHALQASRRVSFAPVPPPSDALRQTGAAR